LLRASAVAGAILAGADNTKIEAADKYAEKIGLAFQIIDDILDCVGDQSVLGKPIGSDQKNNKKTYVSFHGIEKAKSDAKRLTQEALCALDVFEDITFLTELSDFLCTRKM